MDNNSQKPCEILAAMSAEIGTLAMKKNPQGYFAHTIESLMSALHPVATKHNVVFSQAVLFHSQESIKKTGRSGSELDAYTVTVVLEVTAVTPAGNISTQEVILSEDYADKAFTQAMSSAYKYAIIRLLALPGVNGDNESRNPPQKKQEPQKMPPHPKAPTWKEVTFDEAFNWESYKAGQVELGADGKTLGAKNTSTLEYVKFEDRTQAEKYCFQHQLTLSV